MKKVFCLALFVILTVGMLFITTSCDVLSGISDLQPHNHFFTVYESEDFSPPDGYTSFRCECGVIYTFPDTFAGTQKTGSYSGYVTESNYDGEADEAQLLGNTTVTVCKNGVVVAETVSDASGYFSFPELPAGTYSVTFVSANYYTLTIEVTIAGAVSQSVCMDYQQDSVLTGRVTVADADMDQSNNEVLQNARVTLKKLTGSDQFSRTAFSDRSGIYMFETLPAGNYLLTVEKDGYVRVEQYVIIIRGSTTVQNMAMEIVPRPSDESKTGGVSGMIYDAAQQGNVGVSGLTLRFRNGMNNVGSDEVILTATTGANGVYSAGGLKPGNYTVSVTDERTLGSENLRYNETYFNIKIMADIVIGNQNGYVSNNALSGQLQIVLSWGLSPSDLDSHFTGPLSGSDRRFHVYYDSKNASGNIAGLDRDDTDSYGPETTTLYRSGDGVYRFSVHDYSNRSAYTSTAMANSNAKVEVYFGGVLKYTFYVPNQGGTLWTVFEYDTTTGILTAINTMSYQSEPSAVQ